MEYMRPGIIAEKKEHQREKQPEQENIYWWNASVTLLIPFLKILTKLKRDERKLSSADVGDLAGCM